MLMGPYTVTTLECCPSTFVKPPHNEQLSRGDSETSKTRKSNSILPPTHPPTAHKIALQSAVSP